jgi:hypothetical protein
VRDKQPLQIAVTPGAIQGEWTAVSSPELQPSDQVVGSLSSSSEENSGFMMGGPPPDAGGIPVGGMGGGQP